MEALILTFLSPLRMLDRKEKGTIKAEVVRELLKNFNLRSDWKEEETKQMNLANGKTLNFDQFVS